MSEICGRHTLIIKIFCTKCSKANIENSIANCNEFTAIDEEKMCRMLHYLLTNEVGSSKI